MREIDVIKEVAVSSRRAGNMSKTSSTRLKNQSKESFRKKNNDSKDSSDLSRVFLSKKNSLLNGKKDSVVTNMVEGSKNSSIHNP